MTTQHQMTKEFKLKRWLTLALTVWLLIPLASHSAQAQNERPIDKMGVLKAIDVIAKADSSTRKYGAKYLIQQVQRFGVDFELAKDEKYEVSLQDALQKANLDPEVIKAVRNNYRPDPEAVNAYNRAIEEYSAGRYQEAVNAYQNAVQRDSKFAEAYYGRGLAYYRLGQMKEAAVDFEQAKQLKSDYSDAYFGLGLLLYNFSGETEKALKAFERVTQISPEYADAHYMLGAIRCSLGDYKEAIDSLNKAIAIQKNLEQEAQKGDNQKIQKDLNQAIQRRAGEIVRAPSEIARAHYYLGISYFASGKKKEAVEAYKEAARLKPNDAESFYGLGLAYYGLNSYQEAAEAFEKAIEHKSNLEPGNVADAYYRLGIFYLESGNKDKAIEKYRLLQSLNEKLAAALNDRINKQ